MSRSLGPTTYSNLATGAFSAHFRPQVAWLFCATCFILAASLLSGCSRDQSSSSDPNLGFEMGHTKYFDVGESYTPAPVPTWKLEPRGPGEEIHANTAISFKIQLAIPREGRLPRVVFFYFPSDSEAHPTQYRCVPVQTLGESRYQFKVKVTTPRRPGKYEFWAEARYPARLRTGPNIGDLKSRNSTHRSPSWEIEVRP